MALQISLFLAAAVLGATGASDAASPRPRDTARDSMGSRFELLILDVTTRLPDQEEAALAKLRSAPRRRPLFVVRAADIETYVWKTQRITLTREASARLTAALLAADSRLDPVAGSDPRGSVPGLSDRIFQVRLDGEFLYGGLFDPFSSLAMTHPVIDTEWVAAHAIFYLRPTRMAHSPLEESVGDSRRFVRYVHPPAGRHDDPTALKFRPVLRDPRVRDLFSGLGKLLPEPPPPATPEEVRTALIQTDLEVHGFFADGDAEIEPILKDHYVLRYYDRQREQWQDGFEKREVVDRMTAGQWRLPQYRVLAAEPPEITGERSATLRSLIWMRGRFGSPQEINRVVISTRRYEFSPPAWLLAEETHEECGDDSPGLWQVLKEGSHMVRNLRTNLPKLPEPCWPPRKAPGGSPPGP